jgi:hypothetical protein
MEITLYRDSTGNWWDIKDTLVLIGFPTSDEDEVVAYVRKVFPGSAVVVDWDSYDIYAEERAERRFGA